MKIEPYTDEQGYKVNDLGIIVSPGKFEGTPRYLPTFWEVYLNGFADEQSGGVLSVEVAPEDKAKFPELKKRKRIRFVEDSQGFVYEV